MADVAVEKEQQKVAASPEKKEKEVCEKKPVEEVEECKKPENGSADKEAKENGSAEEKVEESEEKNGKTEQSDACCIKRKSTGAGDATDAKAEGVTPEKKAKLDDKVEESSNGDAVEVKA